jgi:signal transduction histidine kinase
MRAGKGPIESPERGAVRSAAGSPTLEEVDRSSTASSESRPTTGSQRSTTEQRGGRVLLVDDDPALLVALPETVRTRLDGVQIDVADSAQGALERLESIDYDAIISDIKMPGMDGLALLKEIGRRAPETPTLLITGHGEHELAVAALRGGAYDFIQKPIERDYFVASLSRAIQVRQLRRQVAAQQAALARYTQELEQHREELRRLTATLLHVQEEERRRLSCELHDDLNQKLAVLVMDVDALERQAAVELGRQAALELARPAEGRPAERPRAGSKETPGLRQALRGLRTRVVELSDDVRGLAYRLHPSILDHLGLAVALQSYVEEFAKREKIRVTFTHRNVPETLPADLSTCLYRVAQEGLRNVAKHAHAARAALTLWRSGASIHLSIKDAGAGFTPREARGLGLISMQERVRALNGKLTIESKPGEGTQIEVQIPFTMSQGEKP